VVAAGTPEQIALTPDSHTGYWLKKVLPGLRETAACEDVLTEVEV
jgi:hypothetical protein